MRDTFQRFHRATLKRRRKRTVFGTIIGKFIGGGQPKAASHCRVAKNTNFVFVATTRLNLLLLSSWLRFSGFNHSPRFTFFGIFSPFDSLFIFLFFIFNVFLCQFCSFFILWLLENPNFRVTCDQMPVFPMLSRF